MHPGVFISLNNLPTEANVEDITGVIKNNVWNNEAGQAQPQMAVGALYRARKAIIVGDPKQVEPVVTDDLKLLKEAYSEPVFANYKNKSLSVQSCADIMNPFGTSYDNGTDYPD